MAKNVKSLKWVAVLVGVLVLGVAGAFAFNLPGFGKFQSVKPVNGAISIPVAQVSDGKAHFFSYAEKGKEYKFFVVKGSDGAIHTAFDACDVCYKEKKGYVQKGDGMVCQNCGKKFEITRIGAESSGGCNPSHLPAKNDGRNVTVKVSDLKTGERFF